MHIPSRPPSSRPFMAAPRPAFYHPAPVIDAALRGIERCIRRAEGVALVVGPPGTGKSLLLAKVVEHVRDDFDVALLAGGSICTRRALWQAILAAIGEPFRGIDEADLRIALVERVRGLAAAGSGLVILVDEAHTLPTRLIEELRLLTNVPTPLPAVHIVLAGTTRLDEMLAAPRLESLAQRIAVRCHLEPLDHATTLDYLRAQTRTAGLVWERLFEEGCDDAVFRLTDGVPRLVNLVCDQALVLVAESDRRVTPADIAAAWREIQRLPAPDRLDAGGHAAASSMAAHDGAMGEGDDGFGVIEFGAGDDLDGDRPVAPPAVGDDGTADPWSGPDVELVFDSAADPFAEFFAHEEPVVERFVIQGPDDFSRCRHVASREGQSMGRLLATIARADDAGRDAAAAPAAEPAPPRVMSGMAGATHDVPATATVAEAEIDDDMVVIEEDLLEPPAAGTATVFSVRPGDYRSLFTRLRRGGA